MVSLSANGYIKPDANALQAVSAVISVSYTIDQAEMTSKRVIRTRDQ
jgi:hypothetical protein